MHDLDAIFLFYAGKTALEPDNNLQIYLYKLFSEMNILPLFILVPGTTWWCK
jgi:hypothetical protein